MKGKVKEYELIIDYCAFMVAIVLARHEVTLENVNVQWSAEKLSESLNKLQYSETPNLRVHSLALKHGIQIFTRCLSKRGHRTVLMLQKEKARFEYFTLKASLKSTEVIFASLNNPAVIESHDSVMERVLLIRNDLMSKSNYGISSHHSASSVFAALYLPLIIEIETELETVIEAEDDGNKTTKSQIITRKSPSKLARRSIQNSAIRIITNTEKLYGRNHAAFYLEAAVKKLKKRKRKEENEIDENDDENGDENDVDDDENVIGEEAYNVVFIDT